MTSLNFKTLNDKMITWEDFEKLDIRIGTIIDIQDFPKARNPSYKIIIDFGKFGKKQSSAQLTKIYSRENLLHKQIIAVINFEPKNIAGFRSECLVLGIYNEKNDVVLLQPERKVTDGMKIG